jgi:hypothetical protein
MWVNRKTIYHKLDELLKQYSFVPMKQLVKEYEFNSNKEELKV